MCTLLIFIHCFTHEIETKICLISISYEDFSADLLIRVFNSTLNDTLNVEKISLISIFVLIFGEYSMCPERPLISLENEGESSY